MTIVVFAACLAALGFLLVPALVLFVEVACSFLRRPPSAPAVATPRTAIVMPAHNEESGIAATLANVMAEAGENTRVLVVADNCTDATAEIAEQAGAEVIRRTAVHMSAEENRRLQAAYRLHVLDVLLCTRNQVLLEQIEVIEPQYLVDAMTETIRALLKRESFQQDIHQLVSSAMENFGDKSLFDVMEEAGISDDWRSETEEHLSVLMLGFLETEEAKNWLRELLS